MQTNPLDTLDLAIINHLRLDGRKSFTDIATQEGVAVGTIRNRYTQLVNSGVLQVYGRLNPHVVGLNTYAQILIAIRPPHLIPTIIDQVSAFPEVSFLAEMSGEFDLELNVMCRDNHHLQELLRARLHPLPGVEQTRTNIYLSLIAAKQPDVSTILSSAASLSSKQASSKQISSKQTPLKQKRTSSETNGPPTNKLTNRQ